MSKSEAQQVWEEHYTERDRVWSGRANVRLVEVCRGIADWARVGPRLRRRRRRAVARRAGLARHGGRYLADRP